MVTGLDVERAFVTRAWTLQYLTESLPVPIQQGRCFQRFSMYDFYCLVYESTKLLNGPSQGLEVQTLICRPILILVQFWLKKEKKHCCTCSAGRFPCPRLVPRFSMIQSSHPCHRAVGCSFTSRDPYHRSSCTTKSNAVQYKQRTCPTPVTLADIASTSLAVTAQFISVEP